MAADRHKPAKESVPGPPVGWAQRSKYLPGYHPPWSPISASDEDQSWPKVIDRRTFRSATASLRGKSGEERRVAFEAGIVANPYMGRLLRRFLLFDLIFIGITVWALAAGNRLAGVIFLALSLCFGGALLRLRWHRQKVKAQLRAAARPE